MFVVSVFCDMTIKTTMFNNLNESTFWVFPHQRVSQNYGRKQCSHLGDRLCSTCRLDYDPLKISHGKYSRKEKLLTMQWHVLASRLPMFLVLKFCSSSSSLEVPCAHLQTGTFLTHAQGLCLRSPKVARVQ